MPTLSRDDNSVLGRWWFTVDRWTLVAVCLLIGFGYVAMLAASPAVAERLRQSRDVFIMKQVVFLLLAGLVVVGVSLLSPRGVRRLALLGCAGAMAATAATLFMGVEIKGARRWISVPGMTVQPSEFVKPCFAVVTAWLLTEGQRVRHFPGMLLSAAVFVMIALLLKSQPDVGMLAVVAAVYFSQLFIGGLNLAWVGLGVGGLAAASVGAVAAPSSSASGQDTPNRSTTAAPTTPALIATPAVARATAGQSACSIMRRSVLSPPWNRMAASAKLPTR